jgi:hypothetical protein
MSFLKPHIEYATTESNVSSIDLENEEDDVSHEDVGNLLATAQDHDDDTQNSREPGMQDTNTVHRNERKRRKTPSTASGPSNTDKVISLLENRSPQEQDEVVLCSSALLEQ